MKQSNPLMLQIFERIRSQAWPVISDKKMLATGYKERFPHLKTKFERGTEENGRTYWLELSYRATYLHV